MPQGGVSLEQAGLVQQPGPSWDSASGLPLWRAAARVLGGGCAAMARNSSSVFYQFRNARDLQRVRFSGPRLGVAELKAQIMGQAGGDASFDLKLTNTQTKEGALRNRRPRARGPARRGAAYKRARSGGMFCWVSPLFRCCYCCCVHGVGCAVGGFVRRGTPVLVIVPVCELNIS